MSFILNGVVDKAVKYASRQQMPFIQAILLYSLKHWWLLVTDILSFTPSTPSHIFTVMFLYENMHCNTIPTT